MFTNAAFALPGNLIPLIAQTDPQISTVEDATLAFSGPQFFTALIAGLLLAFGFQLLLTNLSVATGISVLGSAIKGDSDSDTSESDGLGGTVRTIGTAVGVWTLVTVTISLFAACLLAVKLSFLRDITMGVTIGLVIWAAYFSLLVWISSTAVGSLVGSVVGAATSGFQAIFGTATAALGAKAASSQIVSTAEASAAAIRKELTAYIDPEEVKGSLSSYLGGLKPPELNVKSITAEFEKLLGSSDVVDALKSGNLPTVDRATFEKLVSERTDLSRKDVKRIADELEQSWRKATHAASSSNPLNDVLDFFKSAKPQQFLSDESNKKLNTLLDKLTQQTGNQSPGWQEQAVTALTGIVMGRTDLSKLDLDTMMGKVKEVQTFVEQKAGQLPQVKDNSPAAAIKADVEDYLRKTYPWQMTTTQVKEDFRTVLYDSTASPRLIRQGLEQLSPRLFAEVLQSRGLFTQDKIHALSYALEVVRQDVLQEVTAAEAQEMATRLNRQVDWLLRLTPKERLLADDFWSDFKALLVDSEADPQMLQAQLETLNRETLAASLQQRYDLTEAEREFLLREAERNLQVAIADVEGLQAGVQARVDTQWQKVQDYLRNTGKDELNPEGIQRDLQTLLDDPQAGLHDLQWRLQRFDRDTLVQLLSQQRDLSEADANRILDQVESSWKRVVHAPETAVQKVKSQYEQTTSALADYLRNTGKQELNPEGIRRDLTILLNDPKLGLQAFQERFSHVDRDTLVQLLSQRKDLSEEEVNRIIDEVQETYRSVLRAPQRLAKRVQAKAEDFQTTFADYLRNTDKEELNPEGVQRDLAVLFNDPKLGMERLGDRLSHVDRSTIVALLSQRQDITEAEANEIVDRVLSVKDQFLAQIEAIKAKVQSVIDSIFSRIRDYLNALERPELNYDGIQADVRQLFDDPEAGFESLRERLGQFDRNTLIAVLSSRDDISEADANRIINQVEQVRTNVLQRAERIQSQLQTRLETLKKQAQAQAVATQKAAAVAAWWLFATALISGIASAVGGSIAVQG